MTFYAFNNVIFSGAYRLESCKRVRATEICSLNGGLGYSRSPLPPYLIPRTHT